MKDHQITQAYALAKERYAALGIDTDKAIAILESHGEKATVIGKVTDKPGVNIILK